MAIVYVVQVQVMRFNLEDKCITSYHEDKTVNPSK